MCRKEFCCLKCSAQHGSISTLLQIPCRNIELNLCLQLAKLHSGSHEENTSPAKFLTCGQSIKFSFFNFLSQQRSELPFACTRSKIFAVSYIQQQNTLWLSACSYKYLFRIYSNQPRYYHFKNHEKKTDSKLQGLS